ncbi:MAG TPA: FtsX-like permease family protein [Ilumatobacter sp.]|nr:FtsX-like permease family protein [Ilumatobacter sp.]
MRRLTLKSLWARKRRAVGASIAVIIGVAFLAATMVLGDAMTKGIDALFVEGYSGTDVEVRNSTQLSGEAFAPAAIDASIAEVVATVAGVTDVRPIAEGTAQLVDADGKGIGGNGPPTIGTTWIDFDRNPYVLTEGRAPTGPGEVVIDTGTADTGDLAVGTVTQVRTPDVHDMTIVGLAELRSGSEMGGVTFTWFDAATARELLLGDDGSVTIIDIGVADGYDVEAVRAEVSALLPPGTEALTGAELSDEALQQMEDDFLGFFKVFLLAFALIALLVATFSIANTFSIMVAQRTRESALLRAIGASRRQVLASVFVEALLIGVVASAIGLAAGVGLASGLNALMTAAGFGIPSGSMSPSVSTAVTALAVGTVVTIVAAVAPAIRAARVAPLAAMRDVAIDRSGTNWVRAACGVLLTAAGVVSLVFATEIGDAPVSVAALASLATFVGVVLLGPVVARFAAGAIGAPIAALRGTNGKLARRNATRNPRRTAGTASALMIGTAVVALFASLGSSIKHSFTELLDESFGGDLVVRHDGFSGAGLPLEIEGELAALPEVDTVVPLRDSPIIIDGDEDWVLATDMSQLLDIASVGDVNGVFRDAGVNELAVSTRWADDNDIALGSMVSVTFADGQAADLSVVATYTEANLMGDLLMSTETLDPHLSNPTNFLVMLGLADGVSLEAGREAVEAVAGPFGQPLVESSDDYLDAQAAQLDQMLGLVYGLLALAVIIALIGIANTLSLSLYERTRELGLLRAVGQSRRALRATVRWESVIIALFGTVGGLALGTFMCWGLVKAIAVSEGFGTFAPSYATLAIILGVAVVSGVLAAWRPARRASKLDVLEAIATA